MNTLEDTRISAYLDWVKRTYAEDVVSSFRRIIEHATDPDEINLSSALQQAVRESKKTLELEKNLTLGLHSHCRS